MGKCVIERPRRGSRTALSAKARHFGRIVQYADGPDYDGLLRLPVSPKQEGYYKNLGSKDFSDVLGPLRNYLRSNCGRLWNDVYSEIRRTLGSGGWGVRHILRAHLDVATHTYRSSDGRVWIAGSRGVERLDGFYYRFYVEPETGILRESPRRRVPAPAPAAAPEVVNIEHGKEYRKIDGIWYLHEFTVIDVEAPIFLGGAFIRMRSEKRILSRLKRQLGKKQLKRLGLRNDTGAPQ
jgi:hypothetical protein